MKFAILCFYISIICFLIDDLIKTNEIGKKLDLIEQDINTIKGLLKSKKNRKIEMEENK